MSKADEKLAGVDQALAELGKTDEEISAIRRRFASGQPPSLDAIDEQLQALSEDVSLERRATVSRAGPDEAPMELETWENDNTEVEILDESEFMLLVDESDLEEIERVGEEDTRVSMPPPLPQREEESDGIFKKLFGGRRSSNRP